MTFGWNDDPYSIRTKKDIREFVQHLMPAVDGVEMFRAAFNLIKMLHDTADELEKAIKRINKKSAVKLVLNKRIRPIHDEAMKFADWMEERAGKLKKVPYKEYLDSDHWQRVRAVALYRADYKCQLCEGTDRLNVHHRTYRNRGEEKIEDVTVLCTPCHQKFHDILPKPR